MMTASLRSLRFDVARTLLAFLAAAVPGCAFAQSDFTLAAVGDLIIPRPVSMLQNEGAFPYAPAFRDAVTLLGAADVTYGNLETTIYDPRSFTGSPYSWNGDWMLTSLPAVAADLRAMHFDIVSRSNNHALDWGLEGMRETTTWVNAAGLVQARVGETADEAAAASYYQRAKGKVVVDPVGADDEHKEQGKKDHDAGDRDAAGLQARHSRGVLRPVPGRRRRF